MRNTKRKTTNKSKTRKSSKKQMGGEDYDEKLKIAREKQNEIMELHKKISESLKPFTKQPVSEPVSMPMPVPMQHEETVEEHIEDVSTEPIKYWERYFSHNELVKLRKQINDADTCGIITEKVPIFFKEDLDETFHKYYCMVFIIVGILAKKLRRESDIVIKGGKAIQLVTAGSISHKSNDIDIVIYCKGKHAKIKAHNIAINISEFIKWINPHLVSMDIVRESAPIVKVSLDVDSLNNMQPIKKGHKKAILDINYDAEYLPFLVSKRFVSRKIRINGIDEELLFLYPDIDVQINELIYHMMRLHYNNILNPSNPEFHTNSLFIKKSAFSVNALMDYFIEINKGKYTKPDMIENHANVIYTIIIDIYKHMDIVKLIKSMKNIKQLLTDPNNVESLQVEEPVQHKPVIPRQKTPLVIIDPQTGNPVVPKK